MVLFPVSEVLASIPVVRGAKRPGSVRQVAADQIRRIKQGYEMQVWLSNRATMGISAWDLFTIPPDGYGMEYPRGSGIEHLYGAGTWFGAIADTGRAGQRRRVTTVTLGYEDGTGANWEMYGHPDGRDSFYQTAIDDRNGRNDKGYDDDGDGKVDEDELDGIDNDGDWFPGADDLGRDGLPDDLETGCKGGYDAVVNPDPAFDNYDPAARDSCRPGMPPKDDPDRYTQGNGRADPGEPHIDEDYGAVSENDLYVGYTDTFRIPVVPRHIPLGLKVWQRSFAWRTRVKEPILPFEFFFINIGSRTLDSVYVGFFADADVGPSSVGSYYARNFAIYLEDVRTALVHNPVDKPSTPVGITILGAPRPLDSLDYSFEWYGGEDSPPDDVARYALMSSGKIKPDQYPALSDTRFVFAFGPFSTMKPGDTLKIALALVSGEGIIEGRNNIHDNAARAIELYSRGFTTRPVPPSPPLHIAQGDDRVTLSWEWRPGDPRCNPIETWDDSDKFLDILPPDHWRRRDPHLRCPPAMGSVTHRGGRIFEGFRVWRSESPVFNPRSFALLRQYDVIDDLGFESNYGLEFTITDSNLVRGRKYWYAVTSFSIPGINLVEIPDELGNVRIDTLIAPVVESAFGENARLVQLPFEPSYEVGKVKVVPNPYRSNADYAAEAGGWEGLARFWTENRRVIWFIHLPPRCTLRIFSLSGDLISTIEHDDLNRTRPDTPVGQEEWNLLSASGRAIASGIYVYTVESEYGKQVGKFAIIR